MESAFCPSISGFLRVLSLRTIKWTSSIHRPALKLGRIAQFGCSALAYARAWALSAPLQLIPQNIKIVSVRRLDEVKSYLTLTDADAVARGHRVAGLSIETHHD